MYKILTDEGNVLGYVDNPRYIKRSSNGSFIESTKEDAIGLAFKSEPYPLIGVVDENPIEGVGVDVVYVDGGEVSFNNEVSLEDLTNQVIALQELEVEKEMEDLLSDLDGVDDLVI